MIFKYGCWSAVDHDSEGDTTLTLEHSSTCKHAMTDIEKLRAENVGLAKACKLALKICKFQIKQFDMEDRRYESWAKQIKYFKQALSDSPSAQWVEAVCNLISTFRPLEKLLKKEFGYGHYLHTVATRLGEHLEKLDALEKK
ncbi:MAG: hypothetical protein V3U97_05425 [bacterium]